MQPTFFPWAGYFNLISRADCFVFLDDVQFEKQSWQSRNRILAQGKPAWIIVPTFHRSLSQAINQTEIVEQTRWREKLLRTLAQTYARYTYCDEMLHFANRAAEIDSANLAVVNSSLILAACEKLGLAPRFFRSSELGVSGERTDRLIRICERLECDEYHSPIGAADYLERDGFGSQTWIRLTFQEYTPAPYAQKQTSSFISHLSILDVVASIGWTEAADYVRHSARHA